MVVVFFPLQIDTMSKLLAYTIKRYGNRKALGTREVLGEKEEKQDDGKVMTKLTLGEYHWLRYSDVHGLVDQFGKGIRELGVQPGKAICIFADTRAEWLITALGCFKNSISLCTIYTNLGGEGIKHGIVQTQVETLVTSLELLPKLVPLLGEVTPCPRVMGFE